MFEGARLERKLEADMAGEAALVIAESLVFGRLAMGERRIDEARGTRGGSAAAASSSSPTRRGLSTPAQR